MRVVQGENMIELTDEQIQALIDRIPEEWLSS